LANQEFNFPQDYMTCTICGNTFKRGVHCVHINHKGVRPTISTDKISNGTESKQYTWEKIGTKADRITINVDRNSVIVSKKDIDTINEMLGERMDALKAFNLMLDYIESYIKRKNEKCAKVRELWWKITHPFTKPSKMPNFFKMCDDENVKEFVNGNMTQEHADLILNITKIANDLRKS